jgi:hypothetical protein
MSEYTATISLRFTFHANSGVEADQIAALLAGEVRDAAVAQLQDGEQIDLDADPRAVRA